MSKVLLRSKKCNDKQIVKVVNKYAVYLANQESREIDNALQTLSIIQKRKNNDKIIVRAHMIHPK